MHQQMVEVFTCGGADAYLLVQKIDECLASADSLHMSTRLRLVAISYFDEALRNLGTFAFVAGEILQPSRRSFESLRGWRISTPRYRVLFNLLT